MTDLQWTLVETLQDNYPTLIVALSEDNFDYFAQKYVLSDVSKYEDLELFSNTFISFLSEQGELVNMKNLIPLAKIDVLIKNRFTMPETAITLPSGSLLLWESIHAKQEVKNIQLKPCIEETIKLQIEENEYYLVKEPAL